MVIDSENPKPNTSKSDTALYIHTHTYIYPYPRRVYFRNVKMFEYQKIM